MTLLHEIATWLTAIIGVLGLLYIALTLLEKVVNWFYRWWQLRDVMAEFVTFYRDKKAKEKRTKPADAPDPQRPLD